MKLRFYFILTLCTLTLSGMAQTIGEEMYIYRNDGQINGFLPGEVLSIEYSNKDADGNSYDDIVMQVVNTTDSVYMIPLAEIDSVGFVTPQTVYKPGVINLSDQLMPYIVNSNDLDITFSSTIPKSIMPRVGDKLVTVEMNDIFPVGFIGEVTAVNGTQVTCSKVSLEDVFDSYQRVSSTYGYQEGSISPSHVSRRAYNDFKLGTITLSRSAELSANLFGSDELALKGGTQLSIGITPSFHVVSTLIVNKDEGTYFSACITGDITLQESLSVYGGIDWSKDFLDNEWIKAPVAPLTSFYVKPGLFIRASATVSSTATWTQRFTMGAAFDFSTKKRSVINPTCGGRLASSFDIEGAIDGSLAAGGFLELGLTIASSDIDKLCFRGELGAELVGQAVLYNSDIESAANETKVYERFKNSNISVNAFVDTSVQAECGPWGISYSLPWNLSYNIKKWDVVPTFSNVTFNQCDYPKTSADASIDMSGDCLFPVEVGMSVRDKDGQEVSSTSASTLFDNGNKRYPYTFEGLSEYEGYKLYPKVKIFGIEILAQPSVDIKKSNAANIIISTSNPNGGWTKPPTDVSLSAYITGDAPYKIDYDGFVVDGVEIATQTRTEVAYNSYWDKYEYNIESHLPKTGYFAPNSWHTYYPYTVINGKRIERPAKQFVSYPGVFLPSLSISTKAEYGGYFATYKVLWEDLPVQLADRSESLCITMWGGGSEYGIIQNNARYPLVSSPTIANTVGVHADGGIVGEYSVDRNMTYTCCLYVIVDGIEYRGKSTTFKTK